MRQYTILTCSTTDNDIPTSFSSANRSKEWREAMRLEFNGLLANNTWELVEPYSSMNFVSWKWIYRIKQKVDGSLERYKAQLMAHDFNQMYSINDDETFSPVVKPTAIRLVLSIALRRGWVIN